LLFNLYIAVVLKAFGIVYNQSIVEDPCAPPELNQVKGGIYLNSECHAWCGRNRALCSKCCLSGSGSGTLIASVLCCANHNRRDWLPTREVLLRLQEWKKKRKHTARNFLSFEDIREALQGETKNYYEVNNFQVDFLFSICRIKLNSGDAERIERLLLLRHEQGRDTPELKSEIQSETRRVLQRLGLASKSSEAESNTLAMHEFASTFKALSTLKKERIAASIQLNRQVENVVANQQALLELLQELQTTVSDVKEIPRM